MHERGVLSDEHVRDRRASQEDAPKSAFGRISARHRKVSCCAWLSGSSVVHGSALVGLGAQLYVYPLRHWDVACQVSSAHFYA